MREEVTFPRARGGLVASNSGRVACGCLALNGRGRYTSPRARSGLMAAKMEWHVDTFVLNNEGRGGFHRPAK